MQPGASKSIMKQNRSHAHNNRKIVHLSANVWPPYKASIAISDSFVSSSIVNQVRPYIAVYVLLLLWFLEGGKVIGLARGPHRVCLSSKLQPSIVYAPSHTQSGHIYNHTNILANRWSLVLLATGVRQLPMAPLPSVVIKTPLKYNQAVSAYSVFTNILYP